MSKRYQRATGAAAISVTVAPACDFGRVQLLIHLSAAGGAGNLTVTLDANEGAAYDTVLLTYDMTLVTDLVWEPGEGGIEFVSGDKLVIAWANAGTKTYGLTVAYNQLH